MKGFTGDIYNAHRVFIREEYEQANAGRSEVERLSDLLSCRHTNLLSALAEAKRTDPSLLYRRDSLSLDRSLTQGLAPRFLWEPFKSGHVHKITGEYVKGYRPDYDSYPCWCYAVSEQYCTQGEITAQGVGAAALEIGIGIYAIIEFLNEMRKK